MLTCLLLLLQENPFYFYPKAIVMQYWRARTFVKICYSHGKQINQVNNCFDCQTFYDNLLHFIYFYSNFGQFYNISKFYDILWFYDSVWELCIYKRRTFWKNIHPTSFFQEFSRSKIAFQEFPGVVATLGLGKVKFNELSSKYLQKYQKDMSSSVLLSQAGFVPDSSFVPDRTFRVLKKSFCGGIRFFSQSIIRESFFELWIPIGDVYLKKVWLY